MKLGSVVLVLGGLLLGCSTHDNDTAYRSTNYKFGSKYPLMKREVAEATIVTAMLTKQIEPPLDSPLVLESITLPPYPESLQRSDVQGKITVHFTIDVDGRVRAATPVGTAPKVLADLSVAAIEKWKFKPALRDGKPASLRLTYWFNFVLQ